MWKKLNFAHLGYLFLINIGIKWLIDTPLTIILMNSYGYRISIITTTFLYIIVGIASVKLYDKHKGGPISFIEDLKTNQESKDQLTMLGYVKNLLGMLILGFALALKNIGLVVIWFRDGSFLFNGFPGIFVKLTFLGYLLFINIGWSIVIYFCSPFFIMVWKTIKVIFRLIFNLNLMNF